MKNIGKQFKALVLGIAASAVCTGAVNAQCSSWVNTMGIASNLGGAAVVIDTKLSDGSDFLFYVSTTDDAIGFKVDEEGVKEIKYWDEDQYGTASLTDDDGDICIITCNGNGGITVSVSGPGFTTKTWNVRDTGKVALPGDTCGCSGGANPPTQTVVCTTTACTNTAACRPGTAQGYCQAGTVP